MNDAGSSPQPAAADRGRVPIEILIEREIEERLRAKPWARLDLCFKWRLARDFLALALADLDAGGRARAESEVRARIKRNDFVEGVEYDSASMRVVGMDARLLEGIRVAAAAVGCDVR